MSFGIGILYAVLLNKKRSGNMNFVKRMTGTKEVKRDLSRCQKSIIKTAINKLPVEERFNHSAVTSKVAEILEDRYETGVEDSQNMENQLRRMDIHDITDIGKKVDYYFADHVNLLNR